MKNIIHKLFLGYLILTLITPCTFVAPVFAEDEVPEVCLMQYEDSFESAEADKRIELGTGAVYGDGSVKTGGAANSNFKLHLNPNKGGAVGNITAEFTVSQTDLMSYSGQAQILLYSGAGDRVVDLRWRNAGSGQDLYVNGTEKSSYAFEKENEDISIMLQYNTITKELSLWVDGEKKIDKSTTHTFAQGGDLSYVYFNTTTQMTLSLDSFKWYYAEPNGLFKVRDTIVHETFETDNSNPSSSDNLTLGTSGVTYSVEKGALSASTSATGGKSAYKFKLDSAPSGEYVIETTLHNATGSENSHRLMIGSKLYINWNPKMSALGIAYYNPDRIFVTLPKTIAEFGAKGNVLKVTVKYNTEKGTVKVWFNDIEAWEFTYAQADALTYTSVSEVSMFLFSGSIEMSDFHVYYPQEEPKTDDEKIAEALSELTEKAIFYAPLTASGYLLDDLKLPKEVAGGVAVNWEVSENASDLIDLDTGYVSRGAAETEVTLTANITAGSATETKSFNFKIPAIGETVDGAPALITMGRREEFNTYDKSIMTFTNGAVGLVEVKDGKLAISTSAQNGSAVKANIALAEDKHDLNGEFAVDVFMEKPSTCDGPQVVLTNASGKYLTDIRWFKNNMVRFLYYNAEGTREMLDFPAADYGIDGTLKITIKVDTESGLITMLLNNKLAVENKYNNNFVGNPVSGLMLVKDSAIFSTTVDRMVFYYTKTEDARAVRLDASELSYDSLFKSGEITDGVIAYDVSLPERGVRGSQITWESSHPEIVSANGVVTRPDEDTEVTLTATLTSGSEEAQTSIKFTVLRGGDGDLVILKKDYDAVTLASILTGDLVGNDLISDNLNLYTESEFGSTVTWESSDESLIKPNGEVTRPADESGNIYATLTATVINGDYSLTKEFRLGVLPETYTFSNIPLPERFEDVYHAEYTVHTEGWSCNSDQTSFSYEIDENSTCRGYGGSITEYDGYIEMKRERKHDNPTRFIYYLQPSRQAIGDLAVVQYSLTKIGTGEIKQQIDNGSTHFYWQKNNTFRIRHKNSDGEITETYTRAYTGTVQISYMTDEKTGTITMWVNNDCVLYEQKPYNTNNTLSLSRITTDIEGENFFTVNISEYNTFKAYPVAHKRPEQDKVWLTEELIRGGITPPAEGKLASNLNLVTDAKYGSRITWESSNEEYITSDGIVTRPPNWPKEEEVTLTATISYGCFSVKKEFTFNVMPYYTEDETVAQKDDEFLTPDNWNFLTFDDTDFSSVKTSLNLPDKGPYGSTYLWKTTNSKVITETGRVIRPRWDASPETVTMTAVIIYGAAVRTKEFTFTVLPDELLADPDHMSDEDFFGVWDGSKWTNKGKLDYGYSKNMNKIEAAVKKGDYALAKEELLSYMQNRPASFIANSPKRSSMYTEAFIMSGIRDSENHSHFASISNILSHDYKEHVIPITNSVVKGSVTNYKVSARYNEKSTAYVLSSEYPNVDMRPRMVVTVNGINRTYVASGDTTIRGGKYQYDNFSNEEEMLISNFGEFMGEGLSDLLLQFDFSDIDQNDDVTEAYLYFYAKINEDYANGKELVICREGTDWDASTVTMRSITEYTFNYNGIPGKDTWRTTYNAESEYILQSTRFRNHCHAVAEYAYTGDEKYAYTVIWDLMDFIIDTQGRFVYKEEVAAGRVPSSLDWEVLPNVVRYGAYPRALDTALRLESIVDMFDILKNSRYMTSDACTAILKNLWHGANELEIFLTDPVNDGLGANQKVFEAEGYSTVAAFLPEFLASDDLINSSIEVMEKLLANSFFPDGSYIEGSDGYTATTLDLFIQFWKKILAVGYDYSTEAKELLSKATCYVANLGSNGGVSIAWGDNGKSHTRISMKGQDYYELTRDEVINFINTYGRRGTMPNWTSQLYEGNMLAIMRSDWTDDGTYLFMPSSSFSTHGHADANQIILNAYRKALIIDPGYFSYDNSPERAYAKSTRGHNTVEIDNTNQYTVSGMGTSILKPLSTKNSWVSNANYDFYSVTNYSNKAQAVDDLNKCIEHKRTVTFLKPNIVIVSDLMSPDMNDEAEAAKPHSYKQLWHMSALAALDGNTDTRQFFSNFPTGAQIKIASADIDAVMVKEDGIDTEAWGVASVAPYGYYSKENVLGKETFDTVLMPYKNDGDVVAEHISLGDNIENHDATAMKITVTQDDEVNYIYYMLDYDHEDGAVHTFGNFKSDAELAVVRTAENGDVLETVLYNGSYIKTKKGNSILASKKKVESLSFTLESKNGEIYASSDVGMSDISFETDTTIKNVRYNDKIVEFKQKDGVLTLTGSETEIVPENDSSANKGGVTAGGGSSGGSGGAGGVGGVGGTVVPGGNTPGEGQTVVFKDIDNHWAKESITRMASKGIVNGDGTNFRPDDSVSRAELVTMVVRSLKLTLNGTDTPFNDVPADSWYAVYVKKALEAGIISEDTNFRPDDPVTREEMSKILAGANALLTNTEINVPEDFELNFKDADKISAWAKDYVRYASSRGLMNGMENGNFAPLDTATRAQVATVLDRMLLA